MTPKESYFTQFEILQIQENFTLWLRRDLNPGPLTPFTHMLPLDHEAKGKSPKNTSVYKIALRLS